MELYVNVKTAKQAETVLNNENMSTIGLSMDDYGDNTVLHIEGNNWTYGSVDYFCDVNVNIISFVDYMQIAGLIKAEPNIKMTNNQLAEMRHFKTISKSFYAFYDNYINEDNIFKDISEEDLMKAWLDDKVVKIIPEKKWFVRSKLYGAYANEYMWLIDYENEYGTPEYYEKVGIPKYAKKFNTKEEAEKWTVPATEAVLLEVK